MTTTKSSSINNTIDKQHTVNWALFWGAILGCLSIVLGAFATHSLEAHLPDTRIHTFEVGARYQMYHALALIILSALPRNYQKVMWLWLAGSLIFSGSLYTLVLLDMPILGAVAPIGGFLMISGWLWLAWLALSQPRLIVHS